jgi:hypothetical protein
MCASAFCCYEIPPIPADWQCWAACLHSPCIPDDTVTEVVRPTHLPALLTVHADVSVELDGVADNQALNLPGVAKCQPVVGLLMLEAVEDALQHDKQTTDACVSYSTCRLLLGFDRRAHTCAHWHGSHPLNPGNAFGLFENGQSAWVSAGIANGSSCKPHLITAQP